MSVDEKHNNEANPSGLLNLLFDNDIIYQLSYQMAIQAIKKLPGQKHEEDLYVIERNFARSNNFFKEVKSDNIQSKYMDALRYLQYKQYSKYQTVFRIHDISDKVFFILKGSVSILLPDFNYKQTSCSSDIKDNSEIKLTVLRSTYPALDEIFNRHDDPMFEIKKEFKNQEDNDNDSQNEAQTAEDQQPWGSDARIAQLLHPGMKVVKQLFDNEIFGEIGVEFNVQRSATVVCNSDCELLFLSYHHFNTSITNKSIQLEKLGMRMCNCANFFKGMKKDVLRVFALDTRVEVFNSHEEIFAIGDIADRIYFVEKGEVIISQNFSCFELQPPSDEYEVNMKYSEASKTQQVADFDTIKLAVALYTAGSYFGEDGVIMDFDNLQNQYFNYPDSQAANNNKHRKRVTQAIAKRQSVLLSIGRECFFNNFRALIETNRLSYDSVADMLRDHKERIYQEQRQEAGIIWRESLFKTNVNFEQDEDILQTKSLRKNLFEFYDQLKQMKCKKSQDNLESNIPNHGDNHQHMGLSIQIPEQQHHLYPTYSVELNPNLFVKKYLGSATSLLRLNNINSSNKIYKQSESRLYSPAVVGQRFFGSSSQTKILLGSSQGLTKGQSQFIKQQNISMPNQINTVSMESFTKLNRLESKEAAQRLLKTPSPFLTNCRKDRQISSSSSTKKRITSNHTTPATATAAGTPTPTPGVTLKLKQICTSQQMNGNQALQEIKLIKNTSSQNSNSHIKVKSMESFNPKEFYFFHQEQQPKQQELEQEQEIQQSLSQQFLNKHKRASSQPFLEQQVDFGGANTPIITGIPSGLSTPQVQDKRKKTKEYGVDAQSIISKKLGFLYAWQSNQDYNLAKKKSVRLSQHSLLSSDPSFYFPYKLSSIEKPHTPSLSFHEKNRKKMPFVSFSEQKQSYEKSQEFMSPQKSASIERKEPYQIGTSTGSQCQERKILGINWSSKESKSILQGSQGPSIGNFLKQINKNSNSISNSEKKSKNQEIYESSNNTETLPGNQLLLLKLSQHQPLHQSVQFFKGRNKSQVS